MAPTSEIAVTPSGLKIVYYDKSHRYKLGKVAIPSGSVVAGGFIQVTASDEVKPEFVPSVSTILDKSVPKNLTGWAEKLTVEGVCQLAQMKPIDRLGPIAILAELHASGLRYYQARDQAADRGTSVHKGMEMLAAGDVPSLRDFPVEQRGYVQGLSRFWADHEIEVLFSELMVASFAHQFAGRMDLLVLRNGALEVIDLKTSKAIRDSHHFQTAGYMIGVEESGYGTPDAGYILRVGADGTYEFVQSHATREQFIALRGSVRAQREFEVRGREIKKELAA